MTHIESPQNASRRATSAISYALGAKLFGVPLAMPARHGEVLRTALEQRSFDPAGHITGSKFVGSQDMRSRFRVTDDGIALVTVQGLLVDRGAFLGDLYGMVTSYEGLAEQFQRLAKDPAIKAVVLDIDSPGGMVAGIYDLTEELKKLKREKPVTALAANMAVSAAYAIACCADEVFVTRTGEVGGIGVIMVHRSVARALDQMGVDTTIICEPANKAAGHPSQQLTHGARAEIASHIGDAYREFVRHVAKHRRMSESAVEALGARAYVGQTASPARLVDGVASVSELLAHIRKRMKASGPGPRSDASGGRSAAHTQPRASGGSRMESSDARQMVQQATAAVAAAAETAQRMAATLAAQQAEANRLAAERAAAERAEQEKVARKAARPLANIERQKERFAVSDRRRV